MTACELLIVGAGPAGLSAALAAADAGLRAVVIDENLRPGGQLFKQIHKFFGSREHRAGTRGFRIGEDLLREAREKGVDVRLGYPVYGVFPGGRAIVGTPDGARELQAKKIILASGAVENSLYFEGSDLPGVMTAGAAQTMANLHRVLPGRRVLMAGSGNVGLIVAYQLLQAGAEVAALVEAAPRIGGYMVHANKLLRAGVPILTGHTVLRAFGNGRVEGAQIVRLENGAPVPGTEQALEVDAVLMAVGLTPMAELAKLAGCALANVPALGGAVPLHDEDMRTTNGDVYVAGDITGVEEASTAMEEGRLAGTAAAQALGYLGEAEAEARKQEIRRRMDALRSGEFGDRRREAKRAISGLLREWEEGKSV